VPFDREATLKNAEKALRQGRIDAAIAEYLKIVDAQPRDWNGANALGDLYVRAGQVDKGLAQYTRIADHLNAEGFHSKAAALYKKIIKIRPGEEPALLQLGEIAARQGLIADAKQYFLQVSERRRSRGDKRGAAELSVRLGTLDPEDLDSRLAAARSAADMGDVATALREFRDVAERLGQAGRDDDRVGVLSEVAALDPNDLAVAATLAQAFVARSDLARARKYLSAKTAGEDPKLWLTLAEVELSAGRFDEGRAAVAKAITLDPQQREAAVVMGCRLAEQSAEAGYQVIESVADAALDAKDYAAAAAALHEFVTRVRFHLVALMRLVDVCVDGGLEATMYEAQAQLADAYLEVGRSLEARIISEDLVAREPWNRANIERFRKSLVMLGEADPDAIIADRLSGDSPFMAADFIDLNDGTNPEGPAPSAPAAQAAPSGSSSAAPADRGQPQPTSVSVDADRGAQPQASASRSLGQVFQEFREEVGRTSPNEDTAAEQYRLALTYQDMGMMDDAITALEIAARSPRQRFDAASMLGRLHLERQELAKAISWFERAAEAPAPTTDAGRALLYDLAATLEAAGEGSRALAAFVELEAESGGYRDVARRIEYLSRAQARG
jgi:tetratricopeptide (TPR) repeat protein